MYNYDSTDLRSVTVTAVTADGVETTYTYDANGNTLTAGDKTYTYNDRGQQTGYSNGTTAAAYAYNPSGLRKAKTVGGSTKYFVYNGMNIVYEYSESVADGIAYFYGLNRTHNSEGEIYVYNAHGDVVQLVKDNSVVASYTYDAFGNLTSQIGESDNPFLYCGEYFDAETQTYYLRARYYNPANGRFTQQDAWAFMDTGDPLSLNLYTYCFNNPVMYVDPHGNFAILATLATIAVGAAIGAVIDAGAQLIQNGGNVKDINWRSVGASAAAGAVTTGLAMLTGGVSLGVEATMAWGALTGAAGYVTYNTVNGSEVSAAGFASAMAFGGLFSEIAYKISNPSTNGFVDSKALGTPIKGQQYNYVDDIDVSDKKMYQRGDHFNKHGRAMGYANQKEYEAGAREFINKYKYDGEIYEGKWTGSGIFHKKTQICIRGDGKQVIISKETGQIVDFYDYNGGSGLVNIRRIQ